MHAEAISPLTTAGHGEFLAIAGTFFYITVALHLPGTHNNLWRLDTP